MSKRALVMFLLIFIMIFSSITADFKINDIDYIKPENVSLAFGGNFWASNFLKTKAVFPLIQIWERETNITDVQPVIIDDIVITSTVDGKITTLRKADGYPLGNIKVKQDNPDYSIGNIFAIKKDDKEYQIIVPLNDGVVTSWDIKINYDSMDKPIKAIYKRTWDYDYSLNDNIKGPSSSKLLTKHIALLKENNNLYLGFGTYSGSMVVLDSKNGEAITNGVVDFIGTLGMGVPYKDFNSIILTHSYDSGGLLQGTIINGVFNASSTIDTIHENNLTNAIAYSVTRNPATNRTIGLLIMEDNAGSIIGYDTTNSSILFVVDKYKGKQTLNGFSVTEKYLLVTLTDSANKRSKVVCIDFDQAIIDGYDNINKLANEAVIFEEELNGISNGSALALQIVDQENIGDKNKETIYREVFIVGDKGDKDNLRMYYMDQYNASSKRPIATPYGFTDKGITKESLTVDGGVTSSLSFAGGYLIFNDGKGKTRAYSGLEGNNLALINFKNNEDKVILGHTYIADADIINYVGKDLKDIPMEFYINDELINVGKIDIPEDGLTVNFKYTVPKEYSLDNLKIEARLNMIEPREIEETTYDDNIRTLVLDVLPDEIDLETKNIVQTTPVDAATKNTAKVTIINHSKIELEDVLIQYKANGRIIKEERIYLDEEEIDERYFTWDAPDFDTNVILNVVVDPNREIDDVNRDNNSTSKTIKVNKLNDIFVGCKNDNIFYSPVYKWVSSVTEKYKTVKESKYEWKDNPDGTRTRVKVGSTTKQVFDGYISHWTSDQKKYTERVTIKTDVDTGQQHKDSRGGWEILPYVNNNIEKAKRTTRSGYGVEFKVTVNYSTNPSWETPPSGWTSAKTSYPWGKEPSQKYGEGWLRGLSNATAIAHLPNGNKVVMERITSLSNKYSVTWQLPEITYKVPELNTTWKGRFFSMPARTPDGKYEFYVEVKNMGQNNFACQARDYVEIHGDVWRDTNIRRN